MVWMVKDLRDKISCSFFAASLTHTLVNHIHSIPYQHEGSLPILFSVIQFHFTWFSVALLIFRSCGSVFLFSFVHQHTQRHTQTWSRNSSRRLVLGRNFSTFSRLHINSKNARLLNWIVVEKIKGRTYGFMKDEIFVVSNIDSILSHFYIFMGTKLNELFSFVWSVFISFVLFLFLLLR